MAGELSSDVWQPGYPKVSGSRMVESAASGDGKDGESPSKNDRLGGVDALVRWVAETGGGPGLADSRAGWGSDAGHASANQQYELKHRGGSPLGLVVALD